MATPDEIISATALLLGAPEPAYDDFGHPERAQARKYWTVDGPHCRIFGHTKSEVYRVWLRDSGYEVSASGDVTKPNP